MRAFWKIFYNLIVVPVFFVLILVLAIFNPKYRTGIKGRKNLFSQLKIKSTTLDNNSKKIWFHVSSLGEFEQAKPLIAELKKSSKNLNIIVSFFSPSGYEPSKKYKLADIITYFPFDSYCNARRFISIVKPNVAIFIRYDLWPNHIWELKRKNIPIIIANATMRANTARLYPVIKSFHRTLYNEVDYIAAISEEDKKVFELLNLKHPEISVMGDTRYDQVYQRCNESMKKHLIAENVIKDKLIIVAGSTWEADENIIIEAYKEIKRKINNLLMILVPHEPNDRNIERIELELNDKISHIRFSELNDYSGQEVIIVDSIGNLMTLYKYATIAFVGGSFRGGVHNVLEPAVYGIPVIFGPNYYNSQEAIKLLSAGGAFTCKDEKEFIELSIKLLNDKNSRDKAGSIAKNFVLKYTGATDKFLSYIKKVL